MATRFLADTKTCKVDDGEYRIKAFDQFGKRWKAADCFESTKSDAQATAKAMRDHGRKLAKLATS